MLNELLLMGMVLEAFYIASVRKYVNVYLHSPVRFALYTWLNIYLKH